jgi:hypothetical protein
MRASSLILTVTLAACGSTRSTAVDSGSNNDSAVEADGTPPVDAAADAVTMPDATEGDLMADAPADSKVPTGKCGPAGMLSSGSEPVIDLFVVPAGVIVVRSQSLSLIERDGTVIANIAAPREITAAAFDGTHLAVADMAMVIYYDSDLTKLGQFNLTESCADAVIVSNHRFVCGPSNDWDRIFYTFDLQTGSSLATSDPYTYNGTPMRRVPGTDYFVTVTINSSPSDFHLYEVGADHKAVYIGESPYHGDVVATMIYAFDKGSVHLINQEGTMLKVVGQDCTNSFTSDCFVKDGVLGTLKSDESFVALADDNAGTIFAITSNSNSWDSPCANGCQAQQIDVASRSITSQKTHTIPVVDYRIDISAYDSYCPSLVVAYQSSETNPTYRVDVLDF